MQAVLLLTCMAIAAPSPPLPLSGVITVPDPARSLPRLEKALSWAGLAQPGLDPRKIQRDLSVLGFDPLAPATWKAVGLDAAKPVSAAVDADGDLRVVVLAIADAKKWRAAVEAATTKGVEVQKVPNGIVAATPLGAPFAAIEDGRRAVLFFGVVRRGDEWDLGPATAKKPWADKRRAPRVARARPSPDAWLEALPAAGLQRLEGAAWLEDQGFEVRTEADTGTFQGVAASELVRGASRRVLDIRGAALEATADLKSSGVGAVLEAAGLPKDLGKHLGGGVHAALTQAGDIVAAFPLAKSADPDAAVALAKGLGGRYPGLTAAVKERVLVLVLGRADPAGFEVLASTKGDERAPIEVRAAPPMLFEAIRNRSSMNDGLGLNTMQLVALRLVFRPLLDATRSAQLAVRLPPSHAESTLIVRFP